MSSKSSSQTSTSATDAVGAVGAIGPGANETPDKPRASAGRFELELEVSRQHPLSWVLGGSIVGSLLIWKLGTLGAWGGVVLVALAAFHAWRLVQTLLHPPGVVVVTDREVVLPRGPCKPRPVTVDRGDITSVYFLRRSVPWNMLAPVLVIEAGPRALLFPRDWFASEADQRRLMHALLRDGAV